LQREGEKDNPPHVFAISLRVTNSTYTGAVALTGIYVGSAVVLAACSAAAGYAYLAPACGAFLPLVSRGRTKGVALTFDDGPTPPGTERVLEILAHYRVPAAFFVIGANAARWPDLVRRMHTEGHLICNHTYDHVPTGALRPPSFWRGQLARTDAVVESIIGRRPAFFRPPLGHKSPWMARPIRERGLVTVAWSRRGLDGIATTPERITRRLVPHARDGDILLLHDGREPSSSRDPTPTIEALPKVIEGIRARGLSFVRLDALLGREGYLAAATPTGETATSSA
jgi:peptidoglycan/xylan/chitin deacetylase (PgdA/CDA1 family)